jgi:hypothetical protein
MRSLLLALIALMPVVGAAQAPAPAAPPPAASTPPAPGPRISNGRIDVLIHPPDAENGYYRGTRFDWSGVVARLTWKGHEYFGQWFERYDPRLHDAITGPVDEFLTNDSGLGYAEAKPGEPFVRIGVGAVRKPEEKAYQRFATYDIVDPGTWTVKAGADRIEFVHELTNAAGYSYVYRKTLRLVKDSLVLEYRLQNTGTKTIATSVYNHNFFTIDNQTTGPDVVVRFPFAPRAARPLNGLAEVKGNEVRFLRAFEAKETVFTEVEGFGATAKDYDFRIENRRTRAGVRITGDRPLSKIFFWSAWKTSCPEPYIDMTIAPGKQSTWRITYDFYELPSAAPSR